MCPDRADRRTVPEHAVDGRDEGREDGCEDDLVIVDDDALFTALLGRLLRRSATRHRIFNDAAEALEHLRRSTPRSLLIDLRMPELDGVQLLEALGAGSRPPPSQTFVCSSCTPPADTREAIEALGARLVTKDELLVEGALPALTGDTRAA